MSQKGLILVPSDFLGGGGLKLGKSISGAVGSMNIIWSKCMKNSTQNGQMAKTSFVAILIRKMSQIRKKQELNFSYWHIHQIAANFLKFLDPRGPKRLWSSEWKVLNKANFFSIKVYIAVLPEHVIYRSRTQRLT